VRCRLGPDAPDPAIAFQAALGERCTLHAQQPTTKLITNMAWHGRTLTGLYHSGYTASQGPALLAEPAPPIGGFLRADVAITPPLAGWELPANSYVSLDLLKLAGAELALEAEGGTRERAADRERRRRQREKELPETPEVLEQRKRKRAADRERKRRQRKKERELPEAE
jgi:hypothetical protein